MFIILVKYKKPLDIVDQHLVAHRSFLDEGYQKNYFIASGPQNPRSGGIILSQLTDREQLQKFMQQDPFYLQGVADYEFIEFDPVKSHPNFSYFIK